MDSTGDATRDPAGRVPTGLFAAGERCQLSDPRGRIHTITLVPNAQFHTAKGAVAHDDLIGHSEGIVVTSTNGTGYVAFRPLLTDYVLGMKRGAAIIYPKDASLILGLADIFPGARVLEAGVGSGGLSCWILRALGPHGYLSSYERRDDFAQIAQANGLVPIVEPEVTLGPGAYTSEETAYVSERVYSHVVRMLNEYNVNLGAILLKPNMILPGLDAKAASPAEVAKWTVRVLRRTLPPAVPGVHFLSGGMSEFESTVNLQALQDEEPNAPWSLTFSYGRALQSATLKTWAGEKGNVDAAQKILVALAKANSEAQLGKFKPETHPVPSKIGEGRILQALRLGGPGK